jgi:hypothetical protein
MLDKINLVDDSFIFRLLHLGVLCATQSNSKTAAIAKTEKKCDEER